MGAILLRESYYGHLESVKHISEYGIGFVEYYECVNCGKSDGIIRTVLGISPFVNWSIKVKERYLGESIWVVVVNAIRVNPDKLTSDQIGSVEDVIATAVGEE